MGLERLKRTGYSTFALGQLLDRASIRTLLLHQYRLLGEQSFGGLVASAWEREIGLNYCHAAAPGRFRMTILLLVFEFKCAACDSSADHGQYCRKFHIYETVISSPNEAVDLTIYIDIRVRT